MIGFQKLVIDNNVHVYKLAEEIGVSPTKIYNWFNKNKVLDEYLDFLSSKFNVEKSYLNEIVNDINTYKPKSIGFTNDYIINGDITTLIITNRKGIKFEILIDTKNLQKLIESNYRWNVSYDKCTNEYYVKTLKYLSDGKKESILLHRFIMDVPKGIVVDHHNHNRLDNREENLYITEYTNNSSNRKGANKNNNTGHRNVSYIEKTNEYWVQIMKKGVNYKKVFSIDQFEEACKYSDEMREKLFGNYKGNS